MKWEENVRKVVPYVAGEQPNRPNMIKLNTNECPYPPAPGVRKAAENMESAALRLYPDSNAQPLVDALAAYYDVKPEQVFVGVGSDDVLSMAFMTFFNSGKPILFPDIPFMMYRQICTGSHIAPVHWMKTGISIRKIINSLTAVSSSRIPTLLPAWRNRWKQLRRSCRQIRMW